MKIQILGKGCPNCRRLEQNAREAAAELGLQIEIEKVTDSDRITNMGVLFTPGLAVDGRLISSGKVLSKQEVAALLAAELKKAD